MQGPNVRKLIASKMSLDAVPAGGSFADTVAFLSSVKNVQDGARKAAMWVNAAIQAVRCAVEPNPYNAADDETIAGVLLKEIEAKKGHG